MGRRWPVVGLQVEAPEVAAEEVGPVDLALRVVVAAALAVASELVHCRGEVAGM